MCNFLADFLSPPTLWVPHLQGKLPAVLCKEGQAHSHWPSGRVKAWLCFFFKWRVDFVFFLQVKARLWSLFKWRLHIRLLCMRIFHHLAVKLLLLQPGNHLPQVFAWPCHHFYQLLQTKGSKYIFFGISSQIWDEITQPIREGYYRSVLKLTQCYSIFQV